MQPVRTGQDWKTGDKPFCFLRKNLCFVTSCTHTRYLLFDSIKFTAVAEQIQKKLLRAAHNIRLPDSIVISTQTNSPNEPGKYTSYTIRPKLGTRTIRPPQNTAQTAALSQVERLPNRPALRLDLLLQQRNRVQQLLRARRAPGNVNIHRNNLVHTLQQRIIVEHSP